MGYPIIHIHGADFHVLPLNIVANLTGPLVYVLARRERGERAFPLYVGETGEANGYLGANHRKWDEALRLGMNAVAVHRLADPAKRFNLQAVLRRNFKPKLNEQSTAPEASALAQRHSPNGRLANALLGLH
jgi:hypothetical protein